MSAGDCSPGTPKAHARLPHHIHHRSSGMPQNPSAWQVEAGASEIQARSLLQSGCEANVGYMKPYVKRKHH